MNNTEEEIKRQLKEVRASIEKMNPVTKQHLANFFRIDYSHMVGKE